MSKKLEPGRYGLLIETPLFSLFGDSLEARVKGAYEWFEKQGATVERHEIRFDGVFVIALLPKAAEWSFEWGTPKRIKETTKTSRDFDGSTAREEKIYQKAKAVESAAKDAVSFAFGGVGVLILLYLIANRRK
jgi:hypothetical protein